MLDKHFTLLFTNIQNRLGDKILYTLVNQKPDEFFHFLSAIFIYKVNFSSYSSLFFFFFFLASREIFDKFLKFKILVCSYFFFFFFYWYKIYLFSIFSSSFLLCISCCFYKRNEKEKINVVTFGCESDNFFKSFQICLKYYWNQIKLSARYWVWSVAESQRPDL